MNSLLRRQEFRGPLLLFCLVYSLKSPAVNLNNCREDINRLCSTVLLGPHQELGCLQGHKEKLSLSCKADVNSIRLRFTEGRSDCKKDISNHCHHVLPGSGRIVHCLRKLFPRLEPACQKSLRAYFASKS